MATSPESGITQARCRDRNGGYGTDQKRGAAHQKPSHVTPAPALNVCEYFLAHIHAGAGKRRFEMRARIDLADEGSVILPEQDIDTGKIQPEDPTGTDGDLFLRTRRRKRPHFAAV